MHNRIRSYVRDSHVLRTKMSRHRNHMGIRASLMDKRDLPFHAVIIYTRTYIYYSTGLYVRRLQYSQYVGTVDYSTRSMYVQLQ